MRDTPEMDAEHDHLESQMVARSPDGGGLVRYLVALMVLPLALYLLPFVLVRLPDFEHWGGCLYGPLLDFGFASSGENADVVIFGDSSALFGIDPRQMSAALGRRVINLPNTIGSLPVTGDMALRHYLRSNRSPSLLVFYFAPWNLNYSHEETSGLIYEGEEMLARHGSAAEIFAFARTHPLDPVLFPFRFYGAVPRAAVLGAMGHRPGASMVAAAMGHVSTAPTVPVFGGSCRLPAELVREVGFDSAQALAAKYKSPETKIVFFIAPVPSCGNAAELTSRSYAILGAAPPKEMAAHVYKDDSFFIHLDPSAVPEATESLTAALRTALNDIPHAAGLSSDSQARPEVPAHTEAQR